MDPWEAMERQQNHVPAAERGVIAANGSQVHGQHKQDGAKSDGFVRKDQSCRYASSDIPSDLLISVGGINYHLHKHPMISRSARLARLIDNASCLHGPGAAVVVELPDLPGGHDAFELVAKFCYGVAVDITATNVAVLRCAAEYLEMTEELEDSNLAIRTEAFLSYVVASSWRDSVIVLRSCEDLSPWADDLQLVRRCSESIAAKACTNARPARWAYAGSTSPASPARTTRAGGASSDNIAQHPMPPADWWVDDVCVLRIDHFVRVITAVQAKGMRGDLIGAAITRYSSMWLSMETAPSHVLSGAPWPQARVLDMVVAGDGDTQTETAAEQRTVVESLISIIPRQKDCASCSFLLRLLRLAAVLKAAPVLVKEVEKLVGMQLDQAALPDILVPSYSYGRSDAAYDVDLVQRLVEQFLVQEQSSSSSGRGKEKQEQNANTKAQRVANLLDGYLSEVSRDRNLGVSKFQALAESLPESACASHDGLYRAVDSYLKAHPATTEHERKRLCRAVDCGKLSREVRVHAARNERLPLRVVVQVLLAEQAKMDAALGRAGKKEDEVTALRLEVQSVNARYMELQREVELLQRQLERVLPPPVAAGKQQGVSGWTSGWKKLGRLGRVQAEHPMVAASPDHQAAGTKQPRRRRNSAS